MESFIKLNYWTFKKNYFDNSKKHIRFKINLPKTLIIFNEKMYKCENKNEQI